jgi:2-iminobutanoate/2-iminopropanoate deaminase
MKQVIHTKDAPEPIGPYSQAIKSGNTLFVSGQIAINPTTGNVMLDNVHEEATQIMRNIGAILKAAGMDYVNIVKTTIFLTNMNNFSVVNEVYGSFFKTDFPARETVQVARLPKDVNIEISVIAMEEK